MAVGVQLLPAEYEELWASFKKVKKFRFPARSDEVRDLVARLTDRQPGLVAHVLDNLGGHIVREARSNRSGDLTQKCVEYVKSSAFLGTLGNVRSMLHRRGCRSISPSRFVRCRG